MEPDSNPQLIIAAASQHFRIKPDRIESLAETICAALDLANYEVSWTFVEAQEMRELNLQYRNKDSSTDVLSFPQEEWPKPRLFHQPPWPLPKVRKNSKKPPQMLGDIVISPADALAHAEEIGHSLDRETAFLLVHGILHLCGHDHIVAEEEQLMIAQQKLIMGFLEQVQEQPLWTACCEVET